MRGQWPLVGRDNEVARITELLRDPVSPGVVLSGPPGVGKTRLGTECATTSERRIVRVSATRAASSIPLGAFAPFLPATGLRNGDDHNALRLAADALVDDGSDDRPVVFVDDAHSLDDASAALLLHLALTARAFVLVTFRTDEPAPDALRHLWKDVLPRIDLEPFAFDDTATLLATELGGTVDNATVHAIHDACQGNALYLRELLSGLVETGALDDTSGMWTLRGPITAPPRLVELVAERLEDLTGRERFVLQALALTEPMGLPIIEGLGWSEEWGVLERKGLAEVRRTGRRQQLFVSHPLHAEVLRATITVRRRNAILRETANSVALFKFRRRDDARRIAVWRLDAGEAADADVLLSAARDARLALDTVAAERFARAAHDAGGGIEASLLLGVSLDDLGRHADAEAVLLAAEGEADTQEDITLAAMARSANLFRGLARADDAEAVLVAAEARVSAGELHDHLTAERAMFALFEGDVERTLALTAPLLATRDGVPFCVAALPAAMIRFLSGRIDEALDISTHAFEARQRLVGHMLLSGAGVYLVAQAMALAELGNLEDAAGTAEFAYAVAAADQDRNGMAWLASALGRAHLLMGRVASAARLGNEVAVLFGDLNHPGARWGYGLSALAHAQLGNADAAEEAIADLDAEADTTVRMMDSELERARAWTLAARGDLPRARAALLVAADAAHAEQLFTLEAALLHDIARLGDAPAAAARLDACAQHVDGAIMAARVAYVTTLAADDAEGLERAADAFEATGALLFAAEAANEAATLHRKDGDSRRATAAAATRRRPDATV